MHSVCNNIPCLKTRACSVGDGGVRVLLCVCMGGGGGGGIKSNNIRRKKKKNHTCANVNCIRYEMTK